MIDLKLPVPPSVNHYWRQGRNRTYINGAGLKYRKTVAMLVRAQRVEQMVGRLRVNIQFFPPDRRIRDLDNLLKALLDALGKGGVYKDDCQIDTLLVQRQEVMKGGMVRVNIQEINHG